MVIKKSCTARKRLNNSDREFDPCNVCDVTRTLIERNTQMLGTKKNNNMPKKGFNTWRQFRYWHIDNEHLLKIIGKYTAIITLQYFKKEQNLKFFKLDFSTTEKQIDSELNHIKKLNF